MNKLNNFADKHFKKLLVGCSLIILLSLAVLMLITNTNIVAATSSSWKDSVIVKANTDIAVSGQGTVNELLSKGVSIDKSSLDSYIDEQEALLDKLIREYYQAKLNGLTNEYDLEAMKAQIENIRNNLLVDFKQQIDVEFSKVQ